jgi:hypothetical protein
MKKFELCYKKTYYTETYVPAQSTLSEELHVIECALKEIRLGNIKSAGSTQSLFVEDMLYFRQEEGMLTIKTFISPDEEDEYYEARITEENFIQIKKKWIELCKERVPGITIKEEHGWFSVDANYDPPPIHHNCTILGERKEW